MTNFPTPQHYVYDDFKGIRTKNGVNSGGKISATICQNIDFVQNSVGTNIQIRSTLGNILIAQYPDYSIIKCFESVQDGVKHCICYVENNIEGVLLEYHFDSGNFDILVSGLNPTGQANGITMKDTAYDVFVFTNGIEYYSVNFVQDNTIQEIKPMYDGQAVTGLALAEQDGSLVIGQEKGFGLVIGSRQGDIYDFDYAVTADDKTKPWYQLFGKGITAVIPYIGGLLVFTKDDSTMLTGNPADIENFSRSDSSLGGCLSFESWCYHDKYLFFYDGVQKNIYYYMQIDTGQKILGTPIAPEVQKYFDDIKRLQIIGYIGDNRNELWLLSDKFKLIYNYSIGEWAERACQDITSYFIYDDAVYSTSPQGKIFKEKEGEQFGMFDGVFYPSIYTMQIIDLGSFSNMKEMEIQPLFTITDNYENKFWIDCVIDGKKTKSKYIELQQQGGTWGDDTGPINPPSDEQFDIALFVSEDDSLFHQIKGKFVSNWYFLQFTIRTEKEGQDFNITAMELKGITQETDTTGRK